MQDDRPTRAVVLKDKSVVMLYNVDGEVYCSDANSTAFKFPLTHAKIVKGKLQDVHAMVCTSTATCDGKTQSEHLL